MNAGRTVFTQLMDGISTHEFRRRVARYRGQYRDRSFSYWDQFLSMAFKMSADAVVPACPLSALYSQVDSFLVCRQWR
jgi:hypothetical protein